MRSANSPLCFLLITFTLTLGFVWSAVGQTACGIVPESSEKADNPLLRRITSSLPFSIIASDTTDAASNNQWTVSTTAITETVAHNPKGWELRQTRRWRPEISLAEIGSVLNLPEAPVAFPPEVNVLDVSFQLSDTRDGSRFQNLQYRAEEWYGSTYWSGPDWTRVGKNWHHSGQDTPSVRRFTAPRNGVVHISGRIYKADLKCGDGIIARILHNKDLLWEQTLNAADEQGAEPQLDVSVQEGDRIRFVVDKRNEISCDTTYWDPVIAYSDGQHFTASDGFSTQKQGENNWSYEMQTGPGTTQFPYVYWLDTNAMLHQSPVSPQTPVILTESTAIPAVTLTDENDAGGLVAIIPDRCTWRMEAAMDTTGKLSFRITLSGMPKENRSFQFPKILTGDYQGGWMMGISRISHLLASPDEQSGLEDLRQRIAQAFQQVAANIDSRIQPELDFWAYIQADWWKQDKLTEGQIQPTTVIGETLEKTQTLLNDLRPDLVPDTYSKLQQELDVLKNAFSVNTQAMGGPDLLYFKVHCLKRKIALANPLLQERKLLFCKRAPTSYSHLVMQYFGWRARPGGGLFVLDNPGYSLTAHDLLNGALETGNVLEPRLSYEADRIVFSYVKDAGKPYVPEQLNNEVDEGFYHIYEVGIDGSGLRQLTQGPYDDLMPTYLPDGNIVFSSTRRKGYARCFGPQFSPRWHVYTLHRMDPNGNDLRTLSFHDTNEWFPTVSNTGLLVYSRWDYIDRDAVTHQNLWASRPDGTNPIALWGNGTPSPHCTFQIQPIPKSHKFVFTGSAHHSITAGCITIVDPEKGDNGEPSLKRITPEVAFPEAETRDIKEYYESPWPLSEKYFLTGYSPFPLLWEPQANPVNALGIYLIDHFGNRELIYRDPVIGSSNPCPLVPRTRPPILSSSLRTEAAAKGEVYLSDVYRGLGNISKGAITHLRIIQIFPKITPIAGNPPIGLALEENARAVLGTVPVEPDGSARFCVPAQCPLLFQALDKDGMAYQTMRTVTYLQPGEKISCSGCHENRMTAAPARPGSAASNTPSEIVAGRFENEPFSYVRMVQPVLDKYCIKCHCAPDAPKKIELTGEPLKGYTKSYWSLCGDKDFFGEKTNPETAAAALVPRFGARNQVQITPPGGLYGARGSRLLTMLRKGHSDLKIEQEDFRRLAEWIDCNAIFYGAYTQEEHARQIAGETLPMPAIQ